MRGATRARAEFWPECNVATSIGLVGRLVQFAPIGAYDAKARLSELLDRVARGEQIVITRHGKAVARLVSGGWTR